METHRIGQLDWDKFSPHVDKLNQVHTHKHALQNLNCDRHTSFCYLKSKQLEAIKHLVKREDVIGLLPTGYGKSLIFEMLPYFTKDVIVLVVSPLNALIAEQLRKLGTRACRASDFDLVHKCTFIIDHPEKFLLPSVLDNLRKHCKKKLVYLIVDEAHCVIQWGPSFRPDYGNLVELKSVIRGVTVLALSATATVEARKQIAKNLSLREPALVQTTADRPNIKLVVRQRVSNGGPDGAEGSYEAIFSPLLKRLTEEQDRFPKTIIYTPLKRCALGMEMALRDRMDGSLSPIADLVVQYHKPATEQAKTTVAHVFATGEARLMFATEAFSMGIDIPDIRQIIHAGPPKTMETLYQEIGRAGRDGKAAEAVLYYNAADIAIPKKELEKQDVRGESEGNSRQKGNYVSNEIRMYCKTSGCRREKLAEHFSFDLHRPNKDHDCCDFCEQNCKCDEKNKKCAKCEQTCDEAQCTPLQEALAMYFECEAGEGLSGHLLSLLGSCQTQEEVASCLTENAIDSDYRENIIHILTHFSSIPIAKKWAELF